MAHGSDAVPDAAEQHGDRDVDLDHAEEGKEVGKIRKLTTRILEGSMGSERARRRRNRRRGSAKCSRYSEDSRRTRASRDARLGEGVDDPPTHRPVAAIRQCRAGALAMARRSSSTDAVAARVSFCGRSRARARGESERGAREGSRRPYPLAAGLGLDGAARARGWSDPRGRYRRRG